MTVSQTLNTRKDQQFKKALKAPLQHYIPAIQLQSKVQIKSFVKEALEKDRGKYPLSTDKFIKTEHTDEEDAQFVSPKSLMKILKDTGHLMRLDYHLWTGSPTPSE